MPLPPKLLVLKKSVCLAYSLYKYTHNPSTQEAVLACMRPRPKQNEAWPVAIDRGVAQWQSPWLACKKLLKPQCWDWGQESCQRFIASFGYRVLSRSAYKTLFEKNKTQTKSGSNFGAIASGYMSLQRVILSTPLTSRLVQISRLRWQASVS